MATSNQNPSFGKEGNDDSRQVHTSQRQVVPPNFIEFYDAKAKFSRWLDRLEGAFDIYGVMDNDQKRSYLIHYVGAETYDTLCDLLSPDIPKNVNYDDLKYTLAQHFDPTPLEIAEYYKFHHRRQQEGETSREYIAALRKLASTCNFGNFLNKALRNQFTCGLFDEKAKEKLLETKDLTLEKALAIAQSAETRKLELEINKVNKEGAKNGITCLRCGGPNHYANKCKYINTTCRYCKIKGHLEKCCLKKRKEGSSHQLEVLHEDDGVYEVNDLDFRGDDKILINIHINNVPVTMEVDSGSAVSVMSLQEFRRKFPRLKLEKTNIKLRTYSNNFLNVVGVAEVAVKVEKEENKLKLFVVSDISKRGLFGRPWLRCFSKNIAKIFPVNSVQSGKIITSASCENKLQYLLQKYHILFSDDKVGEIKGEPVALHVREGCKPIFCRARPVPFALKGKVEREIERLVEQGILVKVDYSENATAVVPVVKLNGEVRLCGDFKVTLNKQLVVDDHPLPTPEELFTGLAGGDKFSKIDLKCAYLQWKVRDEDQKYLTLNTHKGLYRSTRLMYGLSCAPAKWQRKIEGILKDIPGVAVFMDDIQITAPDDDIHFWTHLLAHLRV